jgi:predicted deacylase
MSLRIADLGIVNGSKHSSYKTVCSRAGTVVRLPFSVIRGRREGPTLCVTGGVHGTEYVGMDAAMKISKQIAPEDLSGALVVVPVVNIPAFEARTYICPIDGVNIQGSFPGKSDGTIAQLIARMVYVEFISKSNYYLDLHGGAVHESEIGFAGYFETGNPTIDTQSEEMAKAFGFDYIWRTTKEGEMPPGTSWRTAPENGIPAALVELGSGDMLLPEEVSTVVNGILNVMRNLRMISGTARKREGQKTVAHFAPVRVRQGGFFHVHVKPGDLVSKGDVVGEVTNLHGEVIERVQSTTDGVVLGLIHNPVVDPGDGTVYLGSAMPASIWRYS